MSRQQVPRGSDRPGGMLAGRAALVLAVAVVLAQIAYPLTDGLRLRHLTVVTVLLFATTSLLHAWATRGAGWVVALIVICGGGGLLAEAVGLRTGVPFGRYHYTDTLGATVSGVPVVVPLAWLMMGYPCLLLGRALATRISRARRTRTLGWGQGRRRSRLHRPPSTAPHARIIPVALLGGLTLAAWDLFLDPQMVSAGHWRWTYPTPALPGVAGVPLTNLLGWVLVGVVMVGVLHVCVPRRPEPGSRSTGAARSDLVPGLLLGWTWAGSTLANAVFFDRPAVAWWGGVAMGACVLPYLMVLWGRRP